MHFPHAFQELLRCISWWNSNNNQHHGTKKQSVLILRTETNPKLSRSTWVNEFLQVLHESSPFHLQIDRNGTFLSMSVYGAVPQVQDIYTERNVIVPPAYETVRPDDANVMRKAVWTYCNITTTEPRFGCNKWTVATPTPSNNKKVPPRIGFLNRRPTGGRHVVDYGEIVDVLRRVYGESNIQYLESFDGMSFQEQITYMSRIDILISPHGAQVTNSAFIPSCGGVIELFPTGYYAPHYFGTLARCTGHYHYSIYTGNVTTMETDVSYYMTTSFETRRTARTFNITVRDVNSILNGIQTLTNRWIECCQNEPTLSKIEG
jgi:hypothetical protein